MAHRMHDTVALEDMNLSYYCRGCKQQVRGIPLTEPQYHISQVRDDPWLICRCPTRLCELSFVIYDRLNSRIYDVYPLPSFAAANFHAAIPEVVREDLAEAKRCYYANAYRGAVVMWRRAMQNVILNKLKEPGIEG